MVCLVLSAVLVVKYPRGKYTSMVARHERPTSLVEMMPRSVEGWRGIVA
jgi:hypothetical protein